MKGNISTLLRDVGATAILAVLFAQTFTCYNYPLSMLSDSVCYVFLVYLPPNS